MNETTGKNIEDIKKALLSRYPISDMELLGFNLIDNTFGVHHFSNYNNLIVVWDCNQKHFSVYSKMLISNLS